METHSNSYTCTQSPERTASEPASQPTIFCFKSRSNAIKFDDTAYRNYLCPRSVSLKLKILAALLLPSFLAMNGCSNFPFFTTLNNVQMQYGFMCICMCTCVLVCSMFVFVPDRRHGTCVTRNTATYYKIYYTFTQIPKSTTCTRDCKPPKISQCDSLLYALVTFTLLLFLLLYVIIFIIVAHSSHDTMRFHAMPSMPAI